METTSRISGLRPYLRLLLLGLALPPVMLYPCQCEWIQSTIGVVLAATLTGLFLQQRGIVYGLLIGCITAGLASIQIIRLGQMANVPHDAMLRLFTLALPKLGVLCVAGMTGGFCGSRLFIAAAILSKKFMKSRAS